MTAAASTWEGFSWPKKNEEGRTLQPVRRKSRPSLGADEPAQRITAKQRDAYLDAFETLERKRRPKGVRRGHRSKDGKVWTYSALTRKVLAYFLNFAVRTGRIFPSHRQIATALDISLSHVARILDQLVRGGWITRERRFRPSGLPAGQPGPTLEQDTNYYRVHPPEEAKGLLTIRQRSTDRRNGVTPQQADLRDRLGRMAGSRKALERNLRTAQANLKRARTEGQRRRNRALVASIEAELASLSRREAAIIRNQEPSPTPGAAGPSVPRDTSDG